MKKNLLFASLVISAFSVNAQITISSGDMPVVGQSYIMAHDSTITSYGNAGTSQTWNFASWANNTYDTTSFVNPSSVAGFSSFPTATLAVDRGVNGADFMKASSSLVEILGTYVDFGFGLTAIVFAPSEKFLTFPSNYLTNFNGTSVFTIKFASTQPGLDSIKMVNSINYTSNIDAWGSITTPAFTGLNSLRQNIKEINTQTTYLKFTGQAWALSTYGNNPTVDTSNTYRWWSDTKNFPVAEISADANNIVTDASYLTTLQYVGVTEKTATNNDVNVFPNPASDKITITGVSSESYLLIFDVNGKLVENSRLKKNNTSVNTSDYQNGIYFYQIVTLNGKTTGKGKFAVSK